LAGSYFKGAIRNHRYNATRIDSTSRLFSSVNPISLWWLTVSNFIITIFTLGFGYPYTKIRTARYYAARTHLGVAGSLNDFTDNERDKLKAMGEEFADAFDVEFDIGV